MSAAKPGSILSDIGREVAELGRGLVGTPEKHPVGGYVFNDPDYRQLCEWADEFEISVGDLVEWFDIMRRSVPLRFRNEVFHVVDGSICAICLDPRGLDIICDARLISDGTQTLTGLCTFGQAAVVKIEERPSLSGLLIRLGYRSDCLDFVRPTVIKISGLPNLQRLTVSSCSAFTKGSIEIIDALNLELVRLNCFHESDGPGLSGIFKNKISSLEFIGTEDEFNSIIYKISKISEIPRKISAYIGVNLFGILPSMNVFLHRATPLEEEKQNGPVEELSLVILHGEGDFGLLKFSPLSESLNSIKKLTMRVNSFGLIPDDISYYTVKFPSLVYLEIDCSAGCGAAWRGYFSSTCSTDFSYDYRADHGFWGSRCGSFSRQIENLAVEVEQKSAISLVLDLTNAPNVRKLKITREPRDKDLYFIRSERNTVADITKVVFDLYSSKG